METKTFGNWTVLDEKKIPVGTNNLNRTHYKARCHCGFEAWVLASNLTSGRSKQCKACSVKLRTKSSRLYTFWYQIRGKCENKKHFLYSNFGAKGIRMQPEWVNNFSLFAADVADELGPPPTKTHVLERSDQSLGYVRGNLCWLEREAQRNSVSVNWQGETYTLPELSAKLKIDYPYLYRHIRSDKSVDQIIDLWNKRLRTRDKHGEPRFQY